MFTSVHDPLSSLGVDAFIPGARHRAAAGSRILAQPLRHDIERAWRRGRLRRLRLASDARLVREREALRVDFVRDPELFRPGADRANEG